jgi:hypothetical protein
MYRISSREAAMATGVSSAPCYDLEKFMNAYYYDKTLVNEESMATMMTYHSGE